MSIAGINFSSEGFETQIDTEYYIALRAQVYNTGRSLGQFVSLMEEKAGGLALPDVLITAVGTKVRFAEPPPPPPPHLQALRGSWVPWAFKLG